MHRVDQVICADDALNIFVFTDEGEQRLIQLPRKQGEDDDAFVIRGLKKVQKEYPIDEDIR